MNHLCIVQQKVCKTDLFLFYKNIDLKTISFALQKEDALVIDQRERNNT